MISFNETLAYEGINITYINSSNLNISLIPLREPILWLGLLASSPLMSAFTSLLAVADLGNLG